MTIALVYGFGIAGEATARALLARDWAVIVADDRPTEHARSVVAELGLDYVVAPDRDTLGALLDRCALLAPSPGVPETHPVILAAVERGLPIRSEIDLAFEWEQARVGGPRPMLAVTGTDGKTTTTLMAVEMLKAAGHRAIDAGNTDTPLVTAIDSDVDVFVVECTSFRLAWTTCFRPTAGVWLNLAEDHQDWHTSMASYRAAKARMWQLQEATDIAIGFADDPVVMAELSTAPARHRTFALTGADYRVEDRWLTGPAGPICETNVMKRALPHDLTNALAASALVLETALSSPPAIAEALATFVGAPHRIELVGELAGVRYYDDSKATTPHAVLTAIRAFESVVLIAGGKNKGLDLTPMASEPDRLRAVVAIGASEDLIASLFDGVATVRRAGSMAAAVATAQELARPGDVVLLSPGCASFDWYSGYPARGDDFAACVHHLIEATPEEPR
jgi:UDP-N-acetylmuramoylalanine--D-glutamate ligase